MKTIGQLNQLHGRSGMQSVFIYDIDLSFDDWHVSGIHDRMRYTIDFAGSSQFVGLLEQIDDRFGRFALPQEFPEHIPLDMLEDGFHRR